jgi:hypothetical protein
MPNEEIANGISHRIWSKAPRQLSAVMCRYDLDRAIAASA